METTVIPCSRCGHPCKLANNATADARLLKHATIVEEAGYCPDCAVTDFFKNRSSLAKMLDLNPAGKNMLLDERVQQQFGDLLKTGNADAKPEELDWQRIHANWELPFASTKKRSSRPRKVSR